MSFKEPSSWPRSPLCQCKEANRETGEQDPYHALPGDWTLRLCAVMCYCCPRDTDIIWAPAPKMLLLMAAIDDSYTSARGCNAIMGNFAKTTFDDISKTYNLLPPLPLETHCIHQISPSGIHGPSCKDSHHSDCAEDPGSSWCYNIGFYTRKRRVN